MLKGKNTPTTKGKNLKVGGQGQHLEKNLDFYFFLIFSPGFVLSCRSHLKACGQSLGTKVSTEIPQEPAAQGQERGTLFSIGK